MAELTFEQALEKLENVVKKLENKDISLDEAVKLYNEGLSLSKVCYDLLKNQNDLSQRRCLKRASHHLI